MVRRGSIEFWCRWQALFLQIGLVPGIRGDDPLACRRFGRLLPDEVQEFSQRMGLIHWNQQAILRGEQKMVMGIFQGRQKRQPWIIQDTRPCTEQSIQAVGIF